MTKSELVQLAISNGLLQTPRMNQYTNLEELLDTLYQWQNDEFGEAESE